MPVFLALRLVGFSVLPSALGAFFASHFSTDGLYGIDPPSYLWRGYGLTSQLYALFFLPLGLAFTYRALKSENSKHEARNPKKILNNKFSNSRRLGFVISILNIVSNFDIRISNLLSAVIFLTLTTAGHLGIGMMGIMATIPLLFLDFKLHNIWTRFKKLSLILASSLFILSYWIVPMLLNNNYHIISFWDPIWKFNSYGWYEVIKQFFQGEIFDWQRLPVITIFVTIGFFVLLVSNQLFPFALTFALFFLLYFGRTTWGGLIDLIPGMKDFHQHRFIVGVHIAALFLIPAAIEYIMQLLQKISQAVILATNSKFIIQNLNILRSKVKFSQRTHGTVNYMNVKEKVNDNKINSFNSSATESADIVSKKISPASENLESEMVKGPENGRTINSSTSKESRPQLRSCWRATIQGVLTVNTANIQVLFQNIIFYILLISFISLIAYSIVKQTITYAQLNNRWIGEANNAYKYDEQNFKDLSLHLQNLPKARIYAGRPGNWGKEFRLGSTQMYMLFGISGFDISQFLPETWSPLSENEQNFDERVAEDYDLLNIRYVVAPKNQGFTTSAQMTRKYGPFELYQVPTTGWFDVVSSPMFVRSDKTNYINIVHLWHRSYPRRWKMHPLISVERNPQIPAAMQKVIEMKDEVSYTEGGNSPIPPLKVRGGEGGVKNIFADFPFVFPEATVSAYLKEGLKDTWKVAEGFIPRIHPEELLPGGGTTAIISNEKINRQTYSATVDVPADCKDCMIMFKMSYHPNWIAKIDGKTATKFAVFPYYLAVQAQPGIHSVEFSYSPNRLKVILLIIEAIAAVLFLFRKRIGKVYGTRVSRYKVCAYLFDGLHLEGVAAQHLPGGPTSSAVAFTSSGEGRMDSS
ncbi:YfhO family protein [Candidatus Gottesmanbacteria bacterium]|nr:YfhO family protein [Candidatus Gottesmanbacteria bacterium]